MHDDTHREYLTPQQAGQLLGISERALVEWRRTGRGPAYIRLGGPTGRVRYARAQLDRFMAARMYASTAAEAVAHDAA